MFCNQRFEGFIHTLSPGLLIGGVGKFPEFAFYKRKRQVANCKSFCLTGGVIHIVIR